MPASLQCSLIRSFYAQGLLTRGEALEFLEIINKFYGFDNNVAANEAYLDGKL